MITESSGKKNKTQTGINLVFFCAPFNWQISHLLAFKTRRNLFDSLILHIPIYCIKNLVNLYQIVTFQGTVS